MAKADDRTRVSATEPFYAFTEEAHSQLRTVQDCLHLLCLLTRREEDPLIPLELWTSCLHMLHTQVKDMLDAAPWKRVA